MRIGRVALLTMLSRGFSQTHVAISAISWLIVQVLRLANQRNFSTKLFFLMLRVGRVPKGPQEISQTEEVNGLPRLRKKTKPVTKAMAGKHKDTAKAIESLAKLGCMSYFGHQREGMD
jgi:hypothetical protein